MSSLSPLKETAARMLPNESNLRAAIMSQPDELADNEAVAVAKLLSRLLHSEIASQ